MDIKNKTQLDKLFKIAVESKASDLHLIVGKPPIIRIDGELKEIPNEPVLTSESAQELIFTILPEQQKQKFIQERELDMSYEISNFSRFRVNMHWEKGNVGLVARIVASRIPTMEEILMPQVAYQMMRLTDGLVLVTGPTGSGKSTPLAAMLNLVNSERNCHIVTLEDPIEFIYSPIKSIIKQRELGSDMLSFAAGLKHTLRQDPNVIMVGEMRDLETIAATMTLAETGHLVLATLHTINAAQTVDRIIDAFPPYQQDQIRVQLSMSLRGIISQRLLVKQGGGRIAAREVLINNPAISNLIRENKIAQIKTVIQTAADVGMNTMDQDLKRLFRQGAISKETAVANMLDPRSLNT
ncbi:MAG: type IV pili twitching motility protein PilT [Candidatus Komeilibacteria bacterium RIFCSPLOWO2_02_FULL_48_11]|uniref:Type IV pili twitching motility protein PilT n=1 Tax=Candidatus Komeilibacteria bacterium RIFCSPLOWO2_02_FULL_48_11 TaxID=1798553 RepID=A0A1G2BRC5_9BACT|nr:MAG: type IV pili twitching motility protein PilT [Candidatus Komeilibacteria bacterium RIFCSPLOWO2_02_FULL_48_11]